jgi:hypothetical protein
MFDQLAKAAAGAYGASAVGAWARVENAACAQRLFAIADVLQARMSADDSAEREQWCIDNWDAVAAEVAAAHNVSLGVASHQLVIAKALRERLPRLAEVFAAGRISYQQVNAIVYRTALIRDAEALDHTVPDPEGPTCASNIKCPCRKQPRLITSQELMT